MYILLAQLAGKGFELFNTLYLLHWLLRVLGFLIDGIHQLVVLVLDLLELLHGLVIIGSATLQQAREGVQPRDQHVQFILVQLLLELAVYQLLLPDEVFLDLVAQFLLFNNI